MNNVFFWVYNKKSVLKLLVMKLSARGKKILETVN